ncbi:MAG TPA: threonine synthase [Alphaproteobacteria bacterium]
MRYISTRHGSQGNPAPLGFEDIMLAGLARDGGLYLPAEWPKFSTAEIAALKGLSYTELAFRIMQPFVGDAFDEATFRRLIGEAYASFETPEVAPLKPLGDSGLHLLELFHGPTLAFKDVALQLLGRMLDQTLTARGQHATIVGATSGDTGSAAIEACRGREAIDIVILHPKGRTSEVQRRQMTTVLADNVHNVAVEGTFDDCQDLLKGLFNDIPFRDEVALSGVNSINWARILGQIAYYFVAGAALGAPDRKLRFAVPTGNFGNIYAGYAARAMGLPIEQLVLVTNSNDILARTLASGEMRIGEVAPTLSPSMDIQVASNFERLLFDLYGRDGRKLAAEMESFRKTGALALGPNLLAEARRLFAGARVDDAETVATIAEIYEATGEILDPHTAVGLAGGRAAEHDPHVPSIVLATAHPAKFPDAVEKAIGQRPALPPRLADLMTKEERMTVLPNDLAPLKEFVRAHARAAQRSPA